MDRFVLYPTRAFLFALFILPALLIVSACDSGSNDDSETLLDDDRETLYGVPIERQTLSEGSSVDGTISTSDSRVSDVDESVTGPVDPEDDAFLDLYRLEVGNGSRTISLTSSVFDAYLAVVDFDGNILAEDDDGGSASNSRITLSLSAGTYGVVATTYSVGETGAYTLTID